MSLPRPQPADVLAVVPEAVAEVRAAVAGQDQPPRSVVSSPSVLRSVLESARLGGADWLWLLDGSAVPRPTALAELLRAVVALDGLPEPVVLSGKVVDRDGALVPGQTAWWYRRAATPVVMRAATLRMLPIRAARSGSLLVRAEAAGASPPVPELDGPGAALEWTARLLRREPGYLVPASVAQAVDQCQWPIEAVGRDAFEDMSVTAAMLAGPGWAPKERLWLAAELADRTRSAIGSRRIGVGALVRATAAGVRPALRARRDCLRHRAAPARGSARSRD